jgi:hypothetical protein
MDSVKISPRLTNPRQRDADEVGTAAATLMPLVDAIRSRVFAAERICAPVTRHAVGPDEGAFQGLDSLHSRGSVDVTERPASSPNSESRALESHSDMLFRKSKAVRRSCRSTQAG